MDAVSPRSREEPPAADLRYWLALARVPGIGCVRARRLVEHFRGPRAIFEAEPRALRDLGLPPPARACIGVPDWRGVDRDLEWLARPGHRLLTWGEAAYPPRLREIPDPPIALFVQGDAAVLGRTQMAIVGSRNPTATGREVAFGFGRRLAAAGLAVTSGLATGIDAAGHRGALAAGGITIAVAGNGLGRIYPRHHARLAREIAEQGALASELTPDAPPRPRNFPRRNRIISGLCLGVLVVEAARRSGSLITARLAGEQGREVFAVPGSIRNPMARGCHALLRQGAKLVETVDDIIEEFPPAAAPAAVRGGAVAAADPPADPDAARLLRHLGDEPTPVDLLVARTGLTANAVSSMLLLLELNGHVTSAPGGMYARATHEDFP